MARRFYGGSKPERALSVAELRHMASRRLPPFIFEYLEGGAEDEKTLCRNRAVFDEFEFMPRTLVKVGSVDLTTTLFGEPAPLPLAIAPTGFAGLFARDGDLCLARAAATAGIPFTQSTVSNRLLEDVAAVPGLRHWMQIYIFRTREFTERLIGSARDAGSQALVVTSDASVYGNREWDRRNYRAGTTMPTLRNKLSALLYPRWALDVVAPGVPTFPNIAEALPPGQRDLAAVASWSRGEIDPDLDWQRLAWIRSIWPRKLILKGVLSPQDARQAIDTGLDGIVLTNHGGRQLDGTIPALAALPAIADVARGRMTILIDSGFRRGTDVVKALALGADGVMLGRAALYGLAAAGEQGARRALEIIVEEIRRTLALIGQPELKRLDSSCLVGRSDISLSRRAEDL